MPLKKCTGVNERERGRERERERERASEWVRRREGERRREREKERERERERETERERRFIIVLCNLHANHSDKAPLQEKCTQYRCVMMCTLNF